MTPKEKAEELLNKYTIATWIKFDEIKHLTTIPTAKECALIAVDEIILSAPFEPVDTDWDEAGASAQYWYPQKLEDSAKWWGAVKQEINNL